MSSAALRMMAGDPDALGDIYQEFRPRLTGLCRYFLGSADEAEDATSEVLLRLPTAVKTYNTSLPFARWLMSVARHYCVDLLRRRRSEQRVMQPVTPATSEPAALHASPLEGLMADEERDAVRAAMAHLPKRYSTPLVMRYYQELDYDEMAQRLGTTHENVKTLLFRGKAKLRREITRIRARAKKASWSRGNPEGTTLKLQPSNCV